MLDMEAMHYCVFPFGLSPNETLYFLAVRFLWCDGSSHRRLWSELGAYNTTNGNDRPPFPFVFVGTIQTPPSSLDGLPP